MGSVPTSLPPELLDTETASALYRIRWPVELLIKRMKSLLQMDELRARKGSQLAELYLQGKLLYAAVTEKTGNDASRPHAEKWMHPANSLTGVYGKRSLMTFEGWNQGLLPAFGTVYRGLPEKFGRTSAKAGLTSPTGKGHGLDQDMPETGSKPCLINSLWA
ncbi:MAG: transposase [Thiolinea sp.]